MLISEDAIPQDDSVDAVFTSANFKTYESATYGPTFSVIYGENAVSDRWVRLIEEAQESIHIASGHLRSRPVAEAILARAAARPDMDIRVYLDGQEYTSTWTHDAQMSKLDTCLEEAAGNANKIQKCQDVGFMFAHALHVAGVDVRLKHYSYRWHWSYAVQMHHKYMVVDGDTLVTGSYNLSDNAEHNTLENIMVFSGVEHHGLAQAYEINFEMMWRTGEDSNRFEELVDAIQNHDGEIPLVYPSMALDSDEITMLKALIRDVCPEVDSAPFRQDPKRYQVCYP